MSDATDEDQKMEDRLKYICGLVNDWLKFSEAKNGALVVAVSALAVVIADHFPDVTEAPLVRWLSLVGGCLLIIAGLLSLASFIPRLTFKWSQSKKEKMATDNLFFFEHIAWYSAFDFLDALYQGECRVSQHRKIEAD